MQILVKLQVLKCWVHCSAGITFEVLARVDREYVGLHGDVVDEGLLADRAGHGLAGEQLLHVVVVVGPGAGHIYLLSNTAQRSLPCLAQLFALTNKTLVLCLCVTWDLHAMCSLVSVHVAVGCESLTTEDAGERSLAGVYEHVAVQRTERREHFPAQATVIDFRLASRICRVGRWLHLIMTPQVAGEVLLTDHNLAANWTLVVSLYRLVKK